MSTSPVLPSPTRQARLRVSAKRAFVLLVLICISVALAGAMRANVAIAQSAPLLAQPRHLGIPMERMLEKNSPNSTGASAVMPQPAATILLPTLALTPGPTGTWTPFFSDSFNSNSNGWNIATQPYTDDFGTFNERIAGGVLRFDVQATKSVAAKYHPNLQALTDQSVSVQARKVSGADDAAYGLTFHTDDRGNYYLFVMRDDQLFGVFLYQSQWTALIDWTKTDAIRPGALNRLTATTQGAQMTFLINDRQVGQVTNSVVPSGLAGVVIELLSAGDQASIEFSNFKIDVPSSGMISSPTPTRVPPTPSGPASNWPVVLADTFASNSNNWNLPPQQPDTNDYGTFTSRLGGGTLHIEANTIKGVIYRLWPQQATLADTAVTVNIRQLSGSNSAMAGLFFRRDTNNTRYYVFEITGDGQFSVSRFQQGQWSDLIKLTPSNALQSGAANRITAVSQGSHLTFFINGQQVGQVDDSAADSGMAGILIDMDANLQAAFDFSNFELRSPAAASTPTRTRTATPTLRATAPSASDTPSASGPIVLSESFVSNANGWNIAAQQPNRNDYGTFHEVISGGKFRIDANTVKSVAIRWWPSAGAVTDFSLSADAQQVSGSTSAGYGVIFRKDANNNYYFFEVSNARQFRMLRYTGQWTTLINWTPSNAIQANGVNRLLVVAQGTHFTLSINGQPAGQFDDASIPSGLAGVALDMDANLQGTFEFSNFVLRASPGASNSSVAPPGPLPSATATQGPRPTASATPTSRSVGPSGVTAIPSSWLVVLSDNFTNNSNGWGLPTQQPDVNDYGTFTEEIGTGTLHISAKTTKSVSYRFWPRMTTFSDLAVSVEVRQVSGDPSAGAGLFFRKDANNNQYVMELTGNGLVSVSKIQQGQWSALVQATRSSAFQPGAANRLTAVAQGSHFTFFLNGQQVGKVDDTTASGGVAGVLIDMNANLQATFDFTNFELRAPTGP